MGITELAKSDIAWFAGLFEGEGYIGRPKNSGIQMRIYMSDEDVLQHVKDLIGGNLYARPSSRPDRKNMWIWQLSNWPDVLDVIAALLPLMGRRRRARMQEVLDEARANPRRKGSYRPCDFDLGPTNAGYLWHRNHGAMPVCASCMASYRAYMSRWRANNRTKTRGYEHKARAKRNARKRAERQTQTSNGSASPPSEMVAP